MSTGRVARDAHVQPAIAHALGLEDGYFESFRAGLQAKRDRLCAGLEAAGFGVYAPAGTYFATADIRPLGEPDLVVIPPAFAALGWPGKKADQYERYLPASRRSRTSTSCRTCGAGASVPR